MVAFTKMLHRISRDSSEFRTAPLAPSPKEMGSRSCKQSSLHFIAAHLTPIVIFLPAGSQV